MKSRKMSNENGDCKPNGFPLLFSKTEDKAKKEERATIRQKEEETRIQVISKLIEMDIEEIECCPAFNGTKWLQVFARKEAYLIVYCLVGLAMGMFFTYTVSTISTIEKRFKLTSKQTGLMLAGNDISQVVLSIILSYFGNYGNRPRWVAVGSFCASISSLLSAVPHFVYGPGEDALEVVSAMTQSDNYDSLTSNITGNTTNKMNDFCMSPYDENCDAESLHAKTGYVGPVVILFIAQFFVGIAISLFYSIGFAYLDDNINKEESPMYHSFSFIIRVLGPVSGFFLGSRCLSKYIIPQYQPNISLRDPRWLGAWWLGFLILCVLQACCGVLMLFFPKTLPDTLYYRLKNIYKKQDTSGDEFSTLVDLQSLYYKAREKQKHDKPSMKKLPIALRRLLTNKIFIGNNFQYILTLLAMMGYWSFKPKYIEFQFRKSASEATLFAGIASLLASILGLGISGLVIRVIKPGPRWVAGYSCVLTALHPIMLICLMLIKCPNLDIQGPMSWSPGLGSCDSLCGCSDKYSPVCSKDGSVTFYSSCYAGCSDVNTTANPVEYYNCSCAPSSSYDIFEEIDTITGNVSHVQSNLFPTSLGGNVTQGYCLDDCNAFYKYIIVSTVGQLIHSTGRVGGTLLFLRSIEQRDKGLALGFTTVMISLFAFIPAPIMMGAIVDSACIIWDKTCGVGGNCWLYDSDKFRVIIHAVPAVLVFLSLFGDILIFMNSKELVLYGEDAELIEKTQSEEKKSVQTTELAPLKPTTTDNN